jgi:4-amino-4-deoxy-L-arabinose transferase-like glycosyltransferase
MLKKLLKANFLLIVIILVASFLRLYKLSVNPPSLFGDELDLGYQAYSILKTGRDYQGNFMPIHFHSLAEWRTPLYLYSAVPTVAIFGITPLGVRLPAVIFGILSVFMMFLFVKELLSYGQSPTDKHPRALLAAALMAISPWSLQYSRAGFEVTEMIFLFLLGLWLFFKALKNPKWLWLSVFCLVLTPWVYSTAKFFTPLLLIFMLVVFWKEIFKMPKKNLILGVVAGLVVGIPISFSTLFGGGTERFNYISVFADPTTESQIGFAREMAAHVRGEQGLAITPSIVDRLVYNKFTYWGDSILKNYLSAFSSQFLFIKGDLDPRQSIGMGELYRIEIIPLVLGLAFFFFEKGRGKKVKLLMAFWLLVGALPSALTVDGANHATRLILLLPPLIFFISFGLVSTYRILSGNWRKLYLLVVVALYVISVFFYLHEYYVAYPWNSERWWNYGWGPAIAEIKSIDSNYDRVIISMSDEPAWIYFAGYYEYPPALWQKNFPIGNDVNVDGFGKISHIDKFYFGSPESNVQIYGLGRYIDSKTLYLANASEDGDNLILHPDKTPPGLKLIKAIPFPSGEPAFYIFAGIAK